MNRKNNEQSVKIKINQDNDDKKKVISLLRNRIEYIDDIIQEFTSIYMDVRRYTSTYVNIRQYSSIFVNLREY